jgi:diguanylate cyclase (GGDEF)-like protein
MERRQACRLVRSFIAAFTIVGGSAPSDPYSPAPGEDSFMTVLSCIATLHDMKLVLLAAIVCVSGCWVAFRLCERARDTSGSQRNGWIFLTSVAAGSSVWCTHFTAMLAYDVRANIALDPFLTMASLVIAIAGCFCGYYACLNAKRALAPVWSGTIIGLAVAAMHYTGMLAYRVEGLVVWDASYVVASVVLCIALSIASMHFFLKRPAGNTAALAFFVGAIVTLHFTGMTAVSVVPFAAGSNVLQTDMIQSMALAVAGVSILIAGTGIASYLIDVKNNQLMLDRLRHMALNDTLTTLPNRVFFSDHLSHQLSLARDVGNRVAVICIDLDRFTEINDLHGYQVGDMVLKAFAQRCQDLLTDGEFIARIGSDEFAAVKRFDRPRDLEDFINRLERAFFKPVDIDDVEFISGASMGVAIYPGDGKTQERLMANADLAMYRAKLDISRVVCFYQAQMDEAARERQTLARDLKRAIELDQLELYYQKQTSVETGEVRGYEVLLRWNHPIQGQIPPAVFIPIAEETGIIISLGEWVLRTACREAQASDDLRKIAVNLSPVQLAHIDLARLVHEILIETGLPPNRLELELTESAIIADKTRTLHILRQIKALGVTIALDDFGTGYSSLDTLRSFPFDKIKLDRSFVQEVETSQQAKAIIRAVLTLAHTLDITVLAEGVETEHQLAILRTERCDEAQGYFIGRPGPQRQPSEAAAGESAQDNVSPAQTPAVRIA